MFSPNDPPSVIWKTVLSLWGPSTAAWEPDTFRIELTRRGVDPTDSFMSRLLAGQTIATTNAWAHDHSVFFALCCACDGHPAGDVNGHPTAEQMCWGVLEIGELRPGFLKEIEDYGFDPDEVDAAIAAVLIDDGWVIPPLELKFCTEVFNQLYRGDKELISRVHAAWEKLDLAPSANLHASVSDLGESQVNVQLQRLADCKLGLNERLQRRAELKAHETISGRL